LRHFGEQPARVDFVSGYMHRATHREGRHAVEPLQPWVVHVGTDPLTDLAVDNYETALADAHDARGYLTSDGEESVPATPDEKGNFLAFKAGGLVHRPGPPTSARPVTAGHRHVTLT
jgi:hypothetical protein